MQVSPPLSQARSFPVTVAIALGAIAVSLRWWITKNLSGFAPPSSVARQPWTLLTTILPHVDPIHLAFNLLWWWTLAARVERAWGSLRFLGAVVLLAVISSGAEIAFEGGGVGLSGVVYGLCTLMWVTQPRYPAMEGVVTPRLLKLFAAWFVLCIVLTVAGVWHVGNVAHGSGALAGWVLGRCIIAGAGRAVWASAIAVLTAAVLAAATIGQPWVNFGQLIGSNATKGSLAVRAGRYADAIPLLEAAAQQHPDDASVLTNLGIAYQKTNRPQDALGAYKQAAALDASHRDRLAPAIASILDHQAADAAKRGDIPSVRSLAEEALTWNPTDEFARKILDWVRGVEKAKAAPDAQAPPG